MYECMINTNQTTVPQPTRVAGWVFGGQSTMIVRVKSVGMKTIMLFI